MIVVDASVAVKWFLLEPLSDAARGLLTADAPLLAPDLVLAEVANVLWRRQRLGHIDLSQVAAAATAIPAFFDELMPATRLMIRALEIAQTLDQPAYDCIYIAAAETMDARFVTDDARLLKRLAGTAFGRNASALESWNTR